MLKNIHPLAAAAIVTLCLAAGAAWFFCAHQAKRLGGPAGLSVGPNGHLYIQIQNKLLEHDESGTFVAGHELDRIGVDTLLGDTAFFPNGDILLRRGADTRSLADNVRAFLRLTNTANLSPDAPQTGLYRCSLATRQCRVFGDAPIDFRSAFSIAIDAENDAVFISDSSRHVVRKFTLDGTPVGQPAAGYRFPNQILLHDDLLFVADTNHHRVRAVRPETDGFGAEVAVYDVVPPGAEMSGTRWPSHLVRVGDRWWVNNMTSSMNYGRIDVFDKRWQHHGHIALPGGADPIDLALFGDEVLISDWYGDRVHRVSTDGVRLGDFRSDGLEDVLRESEQRRDFYRLIGWLAVFIAAGIAAMIIFKFTDWSKPKTASGSPRQSADPSEAVHLEPDPQKVKELRRGMRLATVLAAPTFLLVPIALLYAGDSSRVATIVLCWVGFLVTLAVLRWVVAVYTESSIYLDDRHVTLKVYGGRDVRVPLSRLRYSDHAVAAGDAAVFLGRANLALYDRAAVIAELDSRLNASQKISSWAMQLKLIRLRHASGLFTVFVLAIGIIAGLLLAVG